MAVYEIIFRKVHILQQEYIIILEQGKFVTLLLVSSSKLLLDCVCGFQLNVTLITFLATSTIVMGAGGAAETANYATGSCLLWTNRQLWTFPYPIAACEIHTHQQTKTLLNRLVDLDCYF